jgi:C-terminal processing protease CtpA/Prc
MLLKYRFWLTVVILFHLAFVIGMGDKGDGDGQNEGQKQEQGSGGNQDEGNRLYDAEDDRFGSFINKPEKRKSISKIKIHFEDVGEKKADEKEAEEAKDSSKECGKDFYYGVGVQFDYNDTILEVGQGYAADRAGLKKGDKVLGYVDHANPKVFVEGINFRGTEGVGIDIYVIRNGEKLKFSMVREKICYNKKDTP